MFELEEIAINSMKMRIEGKNFMISLETNRNDLKENDFTCSVYTDDYFLMGTHAGENGPTVEGNTVSLDMKSRFLWLQGRYQLLFTLGDTYMGCVEFLVDDSQNVKVLNHRPFSCFDPEDVALSFLSTDAAWGRLATLPGTKELRIAAIHSNRLRLWRELLSINVKEYVRQPSGYVFTCIGKECPARAIRCFYDELFIKQSAFEIVDSTSLYDASLQNPLDGFNRMLDDIKPGATICLDKVGAITATGARTIIQQLTSSVRRGKYSLWLAGTRQELELLFNMYPSLQELFPSTKRLTLLPPSPQEMVHSFLNLLEEWDLKPTEEAARKLAVAVQRGCEDGTIANWASDDINRFYQEQVMPAYLNRMATKADSFAKEELCEEDIDYQQLYGRLTGFEECLHDLNQMVGLENIKKSIVTIAHQVRIYAERRQQGLPTSGKEVFHAVFTGNPGTGKTTVAKMLGRIYHHLGLLSKGEVITVDRSRLVGRFIGDTEDNVKNLLKEARGNVLFIDEAYALYGSEGSNDFGRRAIECLLTSLSEKNPDMLVIFAGYKTEMDRLMTMNPGLQDRFPYKFHFDDYDATQLLQIAEHIFAQDEYLLTDEARAELTASVEQALKQRSPYFGNARWIEQFVSNGIISAQADRLAETKATRTLVREDYQRIEASDIRCAYEQFKPHTIELKPRHKVLGFSA